MSIIWKSRKKMKPSLLKGCQDYLKGVPTDEGNYSTTYYYGLNDTNVKAPIIDFYDKLVTKCTKELGLYHISACNLTFWMQMYNHTTKGHSTHSHFAGTECISWVHFLQVPDQKCFYFMDSYGNKHYPDHQKQFDFIAFPAWALHGVDKVEDPGISRTVTAGNISLNSYGFDGLDMVANKFENTTLWVKRSEYNTGEA